MRVTFGYDGHGRCNSSQSGISMALVDIRDIPGCFSKLWIDGLLRYASVDD